MKFTYRPDIDGLRAAAVTLVMVYHGYPSALPGGFVGVDIFFVISGFLITAIIRDAQRQGVFSFASFYARRIRRIFPALIIVLGVVYVWGWYWLLPDEMASLGRNTFGGASFVANFVLLGETGYFDVGAAQKPLLHLWSLGVEEQFYIAWPLICWLARDRVHLLRIALALSALSFALNLVMLSGHPVATFYLPFTRIWEILCGAALTLSIESASGPRLSPNVKASVGATLILVSTLAFGSASFPGWHAAVPVAGVLLLISAEGSWINCQFARPLPVFVGLISYPLYLWHWPILCFLRAIEEPSAIETAAALLLTIPVAVATYVAVERPIRSRGAGTFKVATLASAMAAIGALGLVAVEARGFDFRVPVPIRGIVNLEAETLAAWRKGVCFLESDEVFDARAAHCIDPGEGPLVMLWGDSFAGALYPGLEDVLHDAGYRLAQFTIAGCPPILGVTIATRPTCLKDNDFVMEQIGRSHPDVVLLDSYWTYAETDPQRLAATVAAIRAQGVKRIVILGPLPYWNHPLPQLAVHYYDEHHELVPAISPLGHGDPKADDLLRREAGSLGVEYISTGALLCSQEGCIARVGSRAEDLSAFDEVHLTLRGSRYLAARIVPMILAPAR